MKTTLVVTATKSRMKEKYEQILLHLKQRPLLAHLKIYPAEIVYSDKERFLFCTISNIERKIAGIRYEEVIIDDYLLPQDKMYLEEHKTV